MMDERMVMRESLFYGLSLKGHVPADHMLRTIDRLVDLSGVPQHLEPHYSSTAGPSSRRTTR